MDPFYIATRKAYCFLPLFHVNLLPLLKAGSKGFCNLEAFLGHMWLEGAAGIGFCCCLGIMLSYLGTHLQGRGVSAV